MDFGFLLEWVPAVGLPASASTTSTETAASEAAAAESSATAAEAAASENDRTAATSAPLVLIVRLLAAYYLMSAIAAGVGDIFRPYSVAA